MDILREIQTPAEKCGYVLGKVGLLMRNIFLSKHLARLRPDAKYLARLRVDAVQREVSTNSVWDGGC